MIVRAYRVLFLVVPLVVGSCAEREGTQFVVPLQNDPYLTVRLTFNEQAAWFMFDTGAGAHTLARWFVDAAGMATEDDLLTGVQARDAAGQPVVLQAIRNAAGRLADGRSIVLESAIVADFPPKFQDEEVGGLLNPQLLASDGQAVVLDLRVPELRFERLDHAVRRIGARTLAQDEFQVCSEADAPIPNLLYAVAVTARDQTAWLILDTGAGVTSIASGSPLVGGLKLEPGGEMMGVAGRPQAFSVAPNLTISFAHFSATVDAQVVEASHGGCGPDGLLGRDALGTCALVLTRDSLAIACD